MSSSAVVPLFPVVGWSWSGRVAVEEEDGKASEDVGEMSVGKELPDSVDSCDTGSDLENIQEINKRLLTFHTV